MRLNTSFPQNTYAAPNKPSSPIEKIYRGMDPTNNAISKIEMKAAWPSASKTERMITLRPYTNIPKNKTLEICKIILELESPSQVVKNKSLVKQKINEISGSKMASLAIVLREEKCLGAQHQGILQWQLMRMVL